MLPPTPLAHFFSFPPLRIYRFPFLLISSSPSPSPSLPRCSPPRPLVTLVLSPPLPLSPYHQFSPASLVLIIFFPIAVITTYCRYCSSACLFGLPRACSHGFSACSQNRGLVSHGGGICSLRSHFCTRVLDPCSHNTAESMGRSRTCRNSAGSRFLRRKSCVESFRI